MYAWDAAGNVGVSETLTFTVELFPVGSAVATSGAAVASVSVVLLLYLKRKKLG
jgi:hypothetical protein